MPKKKPALMRDYVKPLLKIVQTAKPASELPELREPLQKRRGPKKKLVKQQLGRFCKAIAEINSKNKKLTTDSSIAAQLKLRQDYSHLSERHLRRDVSFAIGKLINFLENVRPHLWKMALGISPPAAMTKKLLREKAFEWLRYQLSQ